jgi:hypothetical protein
MYRRRLFVSGWSLCGGVFRLSCLARVTQRSVQNDNLMIYPCQEKAAWRISPSMRTMTFGLAISSARDQDALSWFNKTIHEAWGKAPTRKPPPGGAWPSASERAPGPSAGDWRAYNGRGPRQAPSGARSCRGRTGGVPRKQSSGAGHHRRNFHLTGPDVFGFDRRGGLAGKGHLTQKANRNLSNTRPSVPFGSRPCAWWNSLSSVPIRSRACVPGLRRRV